MHKVSFVIIGCRLSSVNLYTLSGTLGATNYRQFQCTVNVLKFRTLFTVCSLRNCWFSGLEFTICLLEKQTGMTLIRLLLQKQSDLGLHCLSRAFLAGN